MAWLAGQVVAVIGVWFDATGVTTPLEPPRVVGIAVTPQHRLSGVARGLIAVAVGETGAAGYNRLCLYTDGHGLGPLTSGASGWCPSYQTGSAAALPRPSHLFTGC